MPNTNLIERAQIKWHKTMCEVRKRRRGKKKHRLLHSENSRDGERETDKEIAREKKKRSVTMNQCGFYLINGFEKGCKAYEREIKLKNP